jgi:hypothetical protein
LGQVSGLGQSDARSIELTPTRCRSIEVMPASALSRRDGARLVDVSCSAAGTSHRLRCPEPWSGGAPSATCEVAFCPEGARRGWWGRHRDRRLRRLSPGPVVLIGDPALHAAVYPETVSLACILASPYWVSAAVSADRADRARFYSEVARRLDLSEYRPAAVGDPLACRVAREARLVFAKVPPGCRSNVWGR